MTACSLWTIAGEALLYLSNFVSFGGDPGVTTGARGVCTRKGWHTGAPHLAGSMGTRSITERAARLKQKLAMGAFGDRTVRVATTGVPGAGGGTVPAILTEIRASGGTLRISRGSSALRAWPLFPNPPVTNSLCSGIGLLASYSSANWDQSGARSLRVRVSSFTLNRERDRLRYSPVREIVQR